MKGNCRTLVGACLVAALAAATAASAGEIWIEATRDNTLFEEPSGAKSSGSGPFVFTGNNSQSSPRRAVVAFDLAEKVTLGRRILSARLVLHMSQTSGGPAAVSLHRLVAPWGEGASVSPGGGGAPAEAGDATWIHTFHPDGFWASPGGDFVASSASGIVDQAGFYEFGPTPEMAVDVQRWVDKPSSNHGWLLHGDESAETTAKRFDSRENPDVTVRPLLIVEVADDGDEDEEIDDEDEEIDPPDHGDDESVDEDEDTDRRERGPALRRGP